MPKVIAFLGCEKIIADKETSNISLISLLQDVNVPLPPDGTKIPDGAVAPFSWAAFAFWQREPNEVIEYELKASFFSPSGRLLIESQGISLLIEKPNTFAILKFTGLPVSEAGTCRLVLQSRTTEKREWEQKAEYPINVIHVASPKAGG